MKKKMQYMLKEIPVKLWKLVKASAASDGVTIRQWLFDAIISKLGEGGGEDG